MKSDAIATRAANRQLTIGIVGIGYVGLPLALAFAEKGFPTLGLDVDPEKVRQINAGQSYISYIAPARVAAALSSGLRATSDFSKASSCDALLLCVPTPLSAHHEPDLTYVENTCMAIAPYLKEQQLVCLESTTYPGTTREIMVPLLEAGSGLRAGRDFFVAYSPEREDPQNREFTAVNIPKIVGGIDQDSRRAAEIIYGAVIEKIVPVSTCETAEAAKLLENIFRAVNIALVNELKLVFDRMGIDIWEVIGAAATKPFGFMPFYPGPGLGGHCIPIDPFYLTWKAREQGLYTRFIELAGQINSQMPEYVIERLIAALNDEAKSLRGSRVLLLGVGYKKNVEDLRESASLRLIRLLLQRGARVDYHDPHVPVIKPTRQYPELEGMQSVSLDHVADYDAVIIATAHDQVDHEVIATRAKLVIDTRNAIKRRDLPHVRRA